MRTIQDFVVEPSGQERLKDVVRNVSALKEAKSCDYFITRSKKMEDVKKVILQINNTDLSVVIEGETGVGKEVVARAIHYTSYRNDKPFIKINCAALPQDLLESELFGYEQGAFTGAVRQKPGRFELAHNGTVFLDEITELHPSLQGKLLQVLQDEEFSRLGGKKDIKVDVRVIAATNRNLEKALRQRTFRDDLYYRLSVVNIYVPPLRERKEDIPPLTDYFITKYSDRYNSRIKTIPEDLMQLFLEYDWRGNVRELENTIRRLMVLGDVESIAEDIRSHINKKISFTSCGARKPQGHKENDEPAKARR